MDDRPESRTQTSGDDSTLQQTSNSVPPKRPLTRPVGPKLSSSTTRPNAVTRASSTTTPSSLSKPPARPISNSTVRRTTSTATAVNNLHRSKPSIVSVEASGDEAKRDGITAKPKRMSLASTPSATGTERMSTTSRAGAVTPLRRTPTFTSTSSRAGIKSPVAAARTTPVTTARAPTLTSRSRPLSAAGSRTATTLAEKKRLSTIPASPAVKGSVTDEDKENEGVVSNTKRSVRPALGTRKSTRSVLIEQRIHEFELVNQMLQSAMAADGMEGDEKGHLTNEAKETIAKLRSDLAKVRTFEKEHGRIPSESELAAMDDMSEVEVEAIEKETISDTTKKSEEEVLELKMELEQTHARIADLEAKVDEYQSTAFTDNIADEIRSDHVKELEQLTVDYDAKINEIDGRKRSEIENLTNSHKDEIAALVKSNAEAVAKSNIDVETLRSKFEDSQHNHESELKIKQAEFDNLTSELHNLQTNSTQGSAEKDTTIAKLKLELQKSVEGCREVLSEKDTELQTLKDELATTRQQILTEGETNETETGRLKSEIEQLKRNAGALSPVKELTSSSPDKELLNVKQQLLATQTRHAQAKDNAKSKMAKVLEQHTAQVADLESQHSKAMMKLQADLVNFESQLKSKHEELGKLTESHQKSLDDLTSLQTLKEGEATRQQATIEELQKQLGDLKTVKQEELAKSTTALAKLRSGHAKQLSTTEAKLETAQDELQLLRENKHQQDSKAVKELINDLETVRTEHKAVLADLESQVEVMKASAISTQASHEQEVGKLRKEAQAANKSHNAKVIEHTELLQALQSQLDALEAGHAEEISRIQSDAKSAHEESLDDLRREHADQIRQLEDQSKSVFGDLESLEASNTAQVERAKRDAEAAQKKALDKQAQIHAIAMEDIRRERAVKEKELKDARLSLETKISALESEHAADKRADLASLTEKRDEAFAELETKHTKARNDAVEELNKSHTKQTNKLEVQLKSAVAELDGAKFQVRTLKGIMADDERQANEKDEEHKQEMGKIQSDFSRAIMRLSEQSARIAGLESQHGSQLAEIKRTAESESKTALANLEQEHGTAINTLREELESKHKDITDSMTAQHSSALESLCEELSTHKSDMQQLKGDHEAALQTMKAASTGQDDQIEKLKSEHAQKLDHFRAESEKAKADDIDALKVQHDQALTTLKTDLANKHKATIEHLHEDHAQQLVKTSTEAHDKLTKTQSEHDEATKQMQLELDSVRTKLADTKEVENLTARLNDSQKSVEGMREAQAEMLSAISKDYEDEIKKLQTELESLAEASKDTSEIDALKNQLTESHNKYSALAVQHREELRTKETEHQTALEKVQAEVDSIEDARAEENAATVQTKSLLDEAQEMISTLRKTIMQLSEQYENAALEAETQRQIADKAVKDQKELLELKKTLAQAETTASANTPKTKQVNGDSKSKSPKPGLGASRWASADEESTPSKSSSTKDIPLTTESSEPNDIHQTQPKKKVSVQLAGIQESIRQLDDLSSSLLEGNQRLARTLNCVDEDGTLTSGFDDVVVVEDGE